MKSPSEIPGGASERVLQAEGVVSAEERASYFG